MCRMVVEPDRHESEAPSREGETSVAMTRRAMGVTHVCDASLNLTSVSQHSLVQKTREEEGLGCCERVEVCAAHFGVFGVSGWVMNPFTARSRVGVRWSASSGIITREACSVRSGQRSGMLVDKTARDTFMVPLVK